MANTYSTGTVIQEWTAKLQERLDYPQNWKEICDVRLADAYVINYPYMSTLPSLTSHSAGTGVTMASFVLTNGTCTLSTSYECTIPLDFAQLAQCSYAKQMELADLQGKLLGEQLESAVNDLYASFTDFDNGKVTADAEDNTNITLSSDNVDDVIGAMKREIQQANGWDLALRNGMFINWAPLYFEKLETWARQNGYTSADDIIINGMKIGMKYMGVDHYITNKNTANHLIGGVKKLAMLGILKSTFGRVWEIQFPVSTTNLSGIGVHSRVDYGTLVPTNYLPLLFDIQVN